MVFWRRGFAHFSGCIQRKGFSRCGELKMCTSAYLVNMSSWLLGETVALSCVKGAEGSLVFLVFYLG